MTAGIERCYARNPGFVAANLGEELAVLDLTRGHYLGFNPTAAHVWRLLETPQTLTALCDAMMAEFDIDPERCRAELEQLLTELVEAGMVRISDGEMA